VLHWLSVGCYFLRFLEYFLAIKGFRIAIHIRIQQHSSSFFSERWLLGPLKWPVSPFQLRFLTGSNLWLRHWLQHVGREAPLQINLCKTLVLQSLIATKVAACCKKKHIQWKCYVTRNELTNYDMPAELKHYMYIADKDINNNA